MDQAGHFFRALLQGTSTLLGTQTERKTNLTHSTQQLLWRSLLNILTINCVHKVSVRTSLMRVLIGSQCKRWFTLLLIHSQKPCGEYKAISCHSSVEQTKHNPTLVSVLAELCPMNGYSYQNQPDPFSSVWNLPMTPGTIPVTETRNMKAVCVWVWVNVKSLTVVTAEWTVPLLLVTCVWPGLCRLNTTRQDC